MPFNAGKITAGLAVFASLALPTSAQTIVSDGTAGTSVTPNNNTFEITEGTKQGSNLFHSFSRFGLDEGFTAEFINTRGGSIDNVLSRVTGQTKSTIDGTIRSSISGADVFLFNPNGIVFGQSASVDINGSFYTSTANELRFKDTDNVFSASEPSKPFLTSASPEAFGFLSNDPAEININGTTLTNPVLPEESLAFVGGLITITGGELSTPSATVSLVSAGGPGEARIQNGVVDLSQNQSRGPITISEISRINTTGVDGGHIRAVGGDVTIENSSIEANNESAPGRGIFFDVENLDLRNNAFLVSQPLESARGGDVTIVADEAVQLDNFSMIETRALNRSPSTPSVADSGNISIRTSRLDLNASSTLLAESESGQAGNIGIEADGSVDLANDSFITTRTTGEGNAGDISVTANTLNLTGQSEINNDALSGTAGTIALDITDGISIESSSIRSNTFSAIAGPVLIRAKRVELSGGASIEGQTLGAGIGGNVVVNTDAIDIFSGSIITAQSTSDADNAGTSGTIDITAQNTFQLADESSVTVETRRANAGNIKLQVGNRLQLRDNSSVSTSVAKDTGSGGNIDIDPVFVLVDETSKIEADASEGSGGEIDITTDFFFGLRRNVTANANGPGGIVGTVNVDAPDVDIIAGTLKLPESFLNVASILGDPCARRVGKPSSSFFVIGRSSIAPGPDTMQAAPVPNISETDDHEGHTSNVRIQTASATDRQPPRSKPKNSLIGCGH